MPGNKKMEGSFWENDIFCFRVFSVHFFRFFCFDLLPVFQRLRSINRHSSSQGERKPNYISEKEQLSSFLINGDTPMRQATSAIPFIIFPDALYSIQVCEIYTLSDWWA